MKTFLTYQGSTLNFYGKSLKPWVNKYKRPTYIYSSDFIADRYKLLTSSFKNPPRVHYAVKANDHHAVMSLLAKLGAGADVVSSGEISKAMRAGFKPRDIVFSGVAKTRSEIEYALEKGVGQFNVESVDELKRIADIAQKKKTTAFVAFRMNPDVNAKTHPYIATGFKENKFGMDFSVLPELIKIVKQSKDHVQLRGLSVHIGSQILDISSMQEAWIKLKPHIDDIKKQGFEIKKIDIGGGLGIFYDKQDLDAETQLVRNWAEAAEQIFDDMDLEIQCEPGRWLVGHAGVLLSQVQYIKKNEEKNFAILDTGMNHLMRPALYQAHHEILPMIQDLKRKNMKYDFVGPICESSDFLAKNRHCLELKQDDLVVIMDAGAYGRSMSNGYNSREFPIEVLI